MDDITLLASKARIIVDDINKICSWEQKRREEVFQEFMAGVCVAKDLAEKHGYFNTVDNWITAVIAVEPKTKELCEKLRRLLEQGSGIKCGGP